MFGFKTIALSYTCFKYKKSRKAITEVKPTIEDEDAIDLEKSANKKGGPKGENNDDDFVASPKRPSLLV